mgnify:CR=1 FL=1
MSLLLTYPAFILLVVSPALHYEYADDATRLRADLLQHYDKLVPPKSHRTNSFSRAGADCSMQVRFFKVDSVRQAEGRMRIKVWMRLGWTDKRLSWEPAAYGNITETQMLAASIHEPEETEIWLPDIQPYNSREGIGTTLDKALAIVNSSGSVFWSRPGMLDLMCKFSGLVAFPYDQLSCTMEIGGWSMSAAFQGIQAFPDGLFIFSNQETTAGSSYTEYEIESVHASLTSNEYSVASSSPWPIVAFRIRLNRASVYYNTLLRACASLEPAAPSARAFEP